MTRLIDTSLDNKRRRESESEEVAKKPRKGSSWKGKRKRKDIDTAEFTLKRKTLIADDPSRNFVGPAEKGAEHVLCFSHH